MIMISRKTFVEEHLSASPGYEKESYCWYNLPIDKAKLAENDVSKRLINYLIKLFINYLIKLFINYQVKVRVFKDLSKSL